MNTHKKRNLMLVVIVLTLSSVVVWMFATVGSFQFMREAQYQPFGDDQLVNVDTGGITTPIALLFVCAGFSVLVAAGVMLPISAIALSIVAIKGHTSQRSIS